MKNETSERYLKKAERFFKLFNLSVDNIEPLAISDALQRAARDKDDLHRADGDIEDKKVIQAIQKSGLAKSSWQQLKTAVRYYCKYYGYDNAVEAIEQTTMQLTIAEYKKPTKKIKTISSNQVGLIGLAIKQQLYRLQRQPKNWGKLNQQAQSEWMEKHESREQKFVGLASLITLFHITGCRPIEVMSMKAMGNSVIYIKGAKKSKDMNSGRKQKENGGEGSTRGADRFIAFNKDDYQKIDNALVILKNIGWLHTKTPELIEQAVIDSDYSQQLFLSLDSDEQEEIIYSYRAKQFQKHLDLAQSQFRRTSKKALNLKKSLCFYTFRHQLASDLKGDDRFSRVEMAYLLGHLATRSIDDYGRKKSAKGKRDIDVADIKALNNVRTTHDTIKFTEEGPDEDTRTIRPTAAVKQRHIIRLGSGQEGLHAD